MADSFTWTLDCEQLLHRVDSLKKDGETDNSFAKRCGLDPGNFQKFRTHQLKLGPTYIRRISQACNVNINWLSDGQGEKTGNGEYALVDMPKSPFTPTPEPADAIQIEILKAENKTLQQMIENLNNTVKVMQEILEQNREALAQNRVIMNYLAGQIKEK